MKVKVFRILSVATISVGLCQLLSAAEPEDGGGVLDEIMVTAQRSSSMLQSTPLAVTAVTADDLAERNIVNVLQAAEAIPGVIIVPGATNMARISMRGALQSSSGIRANAVVGIYIDDVIQPRPDGALFDLFDIERLEVLRGPQGTLYGRNTTGGAIKIVTKEPSFDWAGTAQISAGNLNAREAKLYVSGPLAEEKLAFSASGVIRQRDGFIDGLLYGRKVGDMDVRSERAKLLFTPTEDLKMTFSVLAVQDYSEGVPAVPLAVVPGVNDPYAFPGRDLTVLETAGSLARRLNNTVASATVSYTISDAWRLESISGYGTLRSRDDGSALTLTPALVAQNGGILSLENEGRSNNMSDRFFSQEIDAYYSKARLTGVLGLYYFREKGNTLRTDSVLPVGDLANENTTEATAVFGQATYALSPEINLTAGLRYTRETQDYYSYQEGSVQGPQWGTGTWTAPTPKIGVDWQMKPNLLAYLSWTKGYRAGGFNPRHPETGIWDPTPYGEEKVDSYEAGLKYRSANGKFRLNTAVYAALYEDMQLIVYLPGSSITSTINASGADVVGLELEPTFRVSSNLQLYGNISITDGEYTEQFLCLGQYLQVKDCTNNKIKGLAPITAMAGFDYTLPLPIPGQLSINGAWTKIGKHYNTTSNETALDQAEARDLYNASIRWEDDHGRWSISLDGRNLANKHYVLSTAIAANPVQPASSAFVSSPREIVLRVGMTF